VLPIEYAGAGSRTADRTSVDDSCGQQFVYIPELMSKGIITVTVTRLIWTRKSHRYWTRDSKNLAGVVRLHSASR
jgi:hypothetical protein